MPGNHNLILTFVQAIYLLHSTTSLNVSWYLLEKKKQSTDHHHNLLDFSIVQNYQAQCSVRRSNAFEPEALRPSRAAEISFKISRTKIFSALVVGKGKDQVRRLNAEPNLWFRFKHLLNLNAKHASGSGSVQVQDKVPGGCPEGLCITTYLPLFFNLFRGRRDPLT
ncbi:hypothetical protein C8R44DRAFT_745717 [Mycena epipterygia]|nr:hypothetical protein C8R44DRAFT_745717 [Mycena epipterygia]